MASQEALIREFFEQNPNRDISHPEVVDWATERYRSETGKVFRDPDRAVRKLHQSGWLIKVCKGVYRYDPDAAHSRDLEDFTPQQKREILERDGYRCVVCGRGAAEGADLQVDHILPKDHGGQASVENGQTLCAAHNFQKKTYSQVSFGKSMFVRLHELATVKGDFEVVAFCNDILSVYTAHGIDEGVDDGSA